MIAIVQRVSQATVTIDGKITGAIESGLHVLAAVEKEDTTKDLDYIATKLATIRIFPNGEKSYDLDVKQIGGAILLVSNFTVAADTSQSRRPSLSNAASPDVARILFADFVERVRSQGIPVETGEFGADMTIESVNEGPTTFILRS
jgi:D-aminoacyl-tRNA deacylase